MVRVALAWVESVLVVVDKDEIGLAEVRAVLTHILAQVSSD